MSRSGSQSSITHATPDAGVTTQSADERTSASDEAASTGSQAAHGARPQEHGGRDGPEPTRYGDWEKGGRCIDF
jgi:hypothetical protein